MQVLLQPFLAGSAFLVGLVLVALGTLRQCSLARASVVTGLTLTLLSAVPVHVTAYIGLCIAVVLWLVVSKRHPTRARPATIALALVALTLAALELPAHIGRAQTFAHPRPIVILGDSLSAGREAWPTAFSTASGCDIANMSHPGARLASGPRQLGHPRSPCRVLVLLGGNDILGGATAQRFSADLEAVLQAVADNGCHGTMLELPLFPFQNGYGRAQRLLAAKYGIVLVPRRVLATALTLPGNVTDGLHLSAAGHAWLGHELGRWIQCRL